MGTVGAPNTLMKCSMLRQSHGDTSATNALLDSTFFLQRSAWQYILFVPYLESIIWQCSPLEVAKVYFIPPSKPFFKTKTRLPEMVLLSSLKINALWCILPKLSKRSDTMCDKHLIYKDRQLSLKAFSYVTRIELIFKIGWSYCNEFYCRENFIIISLIW